MTSRLQRAAWVVAVVLGVLLPFAPAVFGLRSVSFRDTDRIYAPLRTLVVEALRDGRLPLWNPFEGTGKPLFAEGIHSVLHPLSLLGAAVAPSSIDFLILAYLVAAALGAFLLARTLDASPPASAGAGLAFALSGYSVSMTGNLVFLAGLSTLPWLLAAARSAGKGSRWGVVLTSLATASTYFSGDVQVALVGLVLGTLLAADAGGLRGAARALAGFLPGILLAGVQILASHQLIPLTSRALGLDPLEKVQWALDPSRLLEWIVPGLCRGPLAVLPRDAAGRPIPPVFSESLYLGAPLIVAAALGALRPALPGYRRTGLLLAAGALVLLWLALGHHLGARQVLDGVPVWSRFRYSEKLMAPLALCLAVLAARGIDGFGAKRLSAPMARSLAAVALLSGGILLALVGAPNTTAALATRLLGDSGPFYRSTLASGLPHLLVALVALLGLDRLLSGTARSAGLALLVAAVPAAALSRGVILGDRAARSGSTSLRLESDSPTPRIAHSAEKTFERSGRPYFDVIARGSSLLLYPPINAAHRIDTIEPYGAFQSLRLQTLARSLGETWGLHFRRFGLTHVVLPIPWEDGDRESTTRALAGARLTQRDEDLGFEVWAVPHRPWAFFAEQATATPSAQEALLKLIGRMLLGDEGTVVVEAPEPPPTAPGQILAVMRGTERLRVEAESPGPALLIVQDAFWPGWRASIDGQPAEILATDHLVRSVRWPTGRHTLEMVYDPPEIRTGLIFSTLGAVLVLILAAVALRRIDV